MSELDEFNLDRAVKRAWASFQTRLADHVAAMADDDILLVELDGVDHPDGAAPYVQFKAWGDLVRCEASSNAYLDPLFELDEADERVLVDLGWSAPVFCSDGEPLSESLNFHLDLEHSYADRLAAMTVRAFREVWSVPHPAFLSADAMDPAPDGELGLTDSEKDDPMPMAVVARPEGYEDLQRMVDEALAPVFGHPPNKDADGDIPIRSGSAMVFVRVRRDSPVVEVFAPLVRDITGRTRAAEVVADLNRKALLIKFLLIEDSVLAGIALPAVPFVPEHLRAMLSLLSDTADDLDDGLAERLSGRLTFDDTPSDVSLDDESEPTEFTDEEASTDLPPELLTLLHLDPDGVGIDAVTAVQVCGHDRDLILSFLKTCSQEEISWRRHADTAAASGDREKSAACSHEAAAWERTVETLRGALRLVATGGSPGEAGTGGYNQNAVADQQQDRRRLCDDPGDE